MQVNRIVTGHDSRGLSQIDSQGPLAGTEPFVHSPGFSAALVWQTGAEPRILASPGDPAQGVASVLPVPGGTSVMLVTFPPQQEGPAEEVDAAAALDEMRARLPGMAELFEAEHPGFHRTDSIDYGVVLDGEVWLELDHGQQVQLRQGDIVVQGGTRHAWRNRREQPARLLFVLTGAARGGV